MGIPFAFDNEFVNDGDGFNLSFEFFPFEQISLRSFAGGYASTTKNNYFLHENYSLVWLEEALLFHPVRIYFFAPYAGAGFGFYKVNTMLSPKNIKLQDGDFVTVNEIVKNSFCFNIEGGINIPLSSGINFSTDLKYFFLKPESEIIYTNSAGNLDRQKNNKIDLSTLVCMFSFQVIF